MNSRSLLVLAASRYQVPVITTAKRLGYRVITADNVPENPGHSLADRSYDVDTTDKDTILQLARRENVDGIVAACTDVAVPTAAYVAEKLGLRGVPPSSAAICCDKIAFRDFQRRNGMPTPETHLARQDTELDDRFFDKTFILKPDRSAGSKGAFIVRSRDEFLERRPQTLRHSPTGRALLEEFISGTQGTCEGVLIGGELRVAFVLDRQTVAPPYVATSGHRVPSQLPSSLQDRLLAALAEAWKLLDVTDGPFDCDFVATNDEVYILEITPRIGGNCISALLLKAADFDIVECAVRMACREDCLTCRQSRLRPSAVVVLGVSQPGRLHYDKAQAEALSREKWVDHLQMDFEMGEPVLPFINGRHRVGEALIFGENRDDVDGRALELQDRLRLRAI